jgi:hypothetical protein
MSKDDLIVWFWIYSSGFKRLAFFRADFILVPDHPLEFPIPHSVCLAVLPIKSGLMSLAGKRPASAESFGGQGENSNL